MAILKACSVVEQNANTLAGSQVTSATFVGTNTAADLTIRVGRDAPLVQIVGTQTASRCYVSLETINAYHGAQVVISRNTLVPGTGIISIFSGSAGTGFTAAEIANIPTNGAGVVVAVFDGVQQVWR